MPGPSDRSPSGAILDFFAGSPSEPFTATTIASETGYSLQTIRDELAVLVERGLLQTKEITESGQVWWTAHREHGDDEKSIGTFMDAPDSRETGADRQRLLEQHRWLAQFVTRIDITADLDEILRQITEEARKLVGAHQSVTSRTVNQNWEQAINAISLSEKYAEYRDYDTRPDGSGIYSLVCERNQPMRVTQDELEAHPAWNAFGDDADEHPPMQGWLAVPIVSPDGQNMGLIQLSDKYEGEFTEADEAILVQLANVAAAAIENSRLYDELSESKERYRTLFESMTEGYCVIEMVPTDSGEPVSFYFVEANPAFETQTGFQEVVGNTVREVVPDDPQNWLDQYKEVVETGEAVTLERELVAQGRVLQCQAFPIGDAPDGHVGMTVQNITERVEHERRLKASNERLEQFAHATSHDLQEPLRMVSSYLQLLERRYADDLDEDAKEFVEYAVDGADRMREMVEGLLQYSRIETQGEPFESVDLDAVVADARDDLQIKIEENDADLTVEDLPRVEGDANQLRQVFQNLLDNAIEYSGDEPPRIHVGAERERRKWVISVQDEGVGIDPEYTDTIFEVFERLHTHEDYSGTGIGLALCKRIVERHGGDIWVDSEPGEGAKFSFTVPPIDG